MLALAASLVASMAMGFVCYNQQAAVAQSGVTPLEYEPFARDTAAPESLSREFSPALSPAREDDEQISSSTIFTKIH